jgi:hypothetical protein
MMGGSNKMCRPKTLIKALISYAKPPQSPLEGVASVGISVAA